MTEIEPLERDPTKRELADYIATVRAIDRLNRAHQVALAKAIQERDDVLERLAGDCGWKGYPLMLDLESGKFLSESEQKVRAQKDIELKSKINVVNQGGRT